jgi:hypothetical protein
MSDNPQSERTPHLHLEDVVDLQPVPGGTTVLDASLMHVVMRTQRVPQVK